MKSKAPAFQFYPGDWRKDVGLRSCSLAARGLWTDLLCLMWDGSPRGYLRINGVPIPDRAIARIIGAPERAVLAAIAELESNGVFSRAADGAIYSRRMLRDEEVRLARASGGEAGAEHGDRGGLFGPLGGRPKTPQETPLITPLHNGAEPPSKPPPSSSSSSSGRKERAHVPIQSPIPKALESAKFATVWQEFRDYRAYEKRKRMSPEAESRMLKRLAEVGPVAAIQALQDSMANEYQGVFPEKVNGRRGQQPDTSMPYHRKVE